MRNYILIVFVLLSTMIFGQDFKVPDSFKYLKMIKIDQDSLVYLFVNNDFKEDIKLSQEFLEDNFTEEFIGITKIDKTKDSEFLISFTLAPSMDHTYSFYKLINEDYKFKFSISGKQLYIPGNGLLYISGHTNNMFDEHKKFKYSDNKLIEISQPYYYVGLKTKTRRPISIYLDKNEDQLIARLPEGSPIEVLIADFSDRPNYYLIRTSFGLVGWWKFDDEYNSAIENLFYAGD